DETTWNDGAGNGASGGGISAVWPSPSWQADSGVPGTAAGPRQVPDVAGSADPERGVTVFSVAFAPGGDASGHILPVAHRPIGLSQRNQAAVAHSSASRTRPATATRPAMASRAATATRTATATRRATATRSATAVRLHGSVAGPAASSPIPPGWSTIGGTSASAPQWAASLAIIADSPDCAGLPKTAGGPDLGFVAPALYEIAANPSAYNASFTQVLHGTNDIYGLDKGYSAGPGYNMVTGLGTPLLAGPSGQAGLAADLCKQVTGHALSGPTVPVVTGVTPSSGPLAGGGTATISGHGFATSGTLEVQFGTVVAKVKQATATSLVVTIPAAALPAGSPAYGAPTPVDVMVSERSGGEPVTSAPAPGARYSYVAVSSSGAGLPAVTAVSPNGGVPAGGNQVVVYGDGFQADGGATSVTFGGVAAQFKVVSDTELAATVPRERRRNSACSTGIGFTPATLCQVQVVVSNAAGPSPTDTILPGISGAIAYDGNGVVKSNPETEPYQAVTEYDYQAPPVITSVSPDPADYQGSSPITIRGRNLNFLTVQYVDFGATNNVTSQAMTPIIYETASEIELDPNAAPRTPAILPIPEPGGVSVQSLSGISNAVGFGWAGVPTVNSLSSLGGPQTGDELVTMHGLGLNDVDQIVVTSEISPDYGGSSARVLRHLDDSTIEVRLPPFFPGPAYVLACSESGCSKENTKTETYVYYDAGAPTVLSSTVSKGPASGGTQMTLFGYNIDSATAVRFGTEPGTVERFPFLLLYPDGDPFVLPVLSAPGVPGSSVKISVTTPTGTAATATDVFSYTPSAPSSPQAPTVTAGGPAETVVHWRAPLQDGGSPVSSYTVAAVPNFGISAGTVLPASARSYTFHDLHANVNYTIRVAASNAAHGEGPSVAAGTGYVPYRDDGYRVVTADGAVTGAGSLGSFGGVSAAAGSPVVGMATTHDALGYWLAQADGTVTSFGDAPPLRYTHPGSPVVGIASTSTAAGYWLLERDGGVLSFGDAATYPKPLSLPPSDPAVALVAAPDGNGYVVLTEHGQLYDFSSAGSAHATAPLPAGTDAVGLVDLTSGLDVLCSDGSVISASGRTKVLPASDGTPVAIVATPDGKGYWALSSGGTVAGRGDAAPIPSGLSSATLGVSVPAAIADV
ncbi:MAG TPA: IPT/TIG domain-containing protein, partial [Acidimicrobiales bacterium]|nr:IPT/TIG domain-containing protein [Acidimicrobiales bacterium]